MQEGLRAPRWLGPAALFVFALSGCSGLIYQSIWSQYLGLYLGHAAYAQSLVLAIFMGGMAIGAWWASRRSLGWRNLLKAYAVIELIIGVTAALFHPIYVGLTGFAYDTAFPGLPGPWSVQVFKWTSGGLMILPQAILLGMTFPLMSSGLMRRLRSGDGAILGGLYFTNSIGAAFGALLATFVLLPRVGLPGAMSFGAVLNIVVALAAFLLAREPEQLPPPAAASATGSRDGVARVLLVAAFITGATSFVYEIGWVRMLSLVFGSTVHAFELMLAAFIGGLAFGGLWIRRRIDGYASPMRVGGWVQILMGLAALTSLIFYDRAFDWVAWFIRSLSRTNGGYDLYNAVTASVSVLMMAPAAFFAGMTLPLFTLILIRSGGGESSVGRIYAANTVGAIVGVFAAVHLLIPFLGLKLAMVVAAAGDLVLGLALLRRAGGRSQQQIDARYLAALVLCGVALAATLAMARFDPAAMSAGVYRTAIARIDPTSKVIYYRDGKTASVSVRSNAEGVRSISTNGKVDASVRMSKDGMPAFDEITMIMAAVVPLVHHPHPRSAAIIGFGSGMSTHTLLGDPRLERVDTIEIEPAMVEGARLFGKFVDRAYSDPRSHVHIEDARTFFAANRSRYDIILSEPSNPWVSGVSSLFSQEFYDFVPHHLAPGGLMVQWIQLYEINDELVASVVRALSEKFADYRVYLAYNSDLLIVARADGPIGEINADALRPPALQAELAELGIGTEAEIRAHQLGDRRTLAPLFDSLSRRISSDYYPILSLEAPRSRFTGQIANALTQLPVADLPYREMLAGLAPPAPATIRKTQSYAYTEALHHAVDIAAALRTDGSLQAAGSEAPTVAFLRETVGRCKASPSTDATLEAMIQIVSATLPYLQTEARRDLWISPAWISCDQQPAPVRDLLAVIAALARGDGAATQQLAGALLAQEKAVVSPMVRDWLVRAAMLGAITAKDYPAVLQLQEKFGRSLTMRGAAEAYRFWSLNLAQRQLKAAAASSPQ